MNKDCGCQARQLRRLLDKQIQSCDEAITKLIADDEEIKTKAGRQPCYKGGCQLRGARRAPSPGSSLLDSAKPSVHTGRW